MLYIHVYPTVATQSQDHASAHTHTHRLITSTITRRRPDTSTLHIQSVYAVFHNLNLIRRRPQISLFVSKRCERWSEWREKKCSFDVTSLIWIISLFFFLFVSFYFQMLLSISSSIFVQYFTVILSFLSFISVRCVLKNRFTMNTTSNATIQPSRSKIPFVYVLFYFFTTLYLLRAITA